MFSDDCRAEYQVVGPVLTPSTREALELADGFQWQVPATLRVFFGCCSSLGYMGQVEMLSWEQHSTDDARTRVDRRQPPHPLGGIVLICIL